MFKSQSLDEYKCDKCNYRNKELLLDTQYDFSMNNCVILKFNLVVDGSNGNKCHTISVKNFNENHVLIPGDKKNTVFIVKAAIIFRPACQDKLDIGAHYVCWRRTLYGEGWLEISDSRSDYHKEFIHNLNHVYLLFLEKKNFSN